MSRASSNDLEGLGADLQECYEGIPPHGCMSQPAATTTAADHPSKPSSRPGPPDPGAGSGAPTLQELLRPGPAMRARSRSKLLLPRTASLNAAHPHAHSMDELPCSPSLREGGSACHAHPRSGPLQASFDCTPSPSQAAAPPPRKSPAPRRSLQHLHSLQDHRQHDAFFLASLAGLGPAATRALASLPRSSNSRRRQPPAAFRQQSFRPTPRQPHSTPHPVCRPVSPPFTPPSNPSHTNTCPGEIDGPPTPRASIPSPSGTSSSLPSPQLRVPRCTHSLPLPKLMLSCTSASAPSFTSTSTPCRQLQLPPSSPHLLLLPAKAASASSAAPLRPSLSDDPAPDLMASWRKHAAPEPPPSAPQRQNTSCTPSSTPRASPLQQLFLPQEPSALEPSRSSLRALDRASPGAGLPGAYAARHTKERGI